VSINNPLQTRTMETGHSTEQAVPEPTTPRPDPWRITIEGLARHEIMRYVPDRPEALFEILLRIDDLPMFSAAMPFLDTFLCD
jgi:hypothetical protein